MTEAKFDSVIGISIYDFILIFNSNIWPNSASLQDISFQSDLNIDLSRSLRSDVIIPMDSSDNAFLLIIYSNIWPNSAPLRDIYKPSKSE